MFTDHLFASVEWIRSFEKVNSRSDAAKEI